MSKYINCDSEIKPKEKGFYEVNIKGVRTALPEYLEFDGKKWLNLDLMKQENESDRISWIEDSVALKEKPVFKVGF